MNVACAKFALQISVLSNFPRVKQTLGEEAGYFSEELLSNKKRTFSTWKVWWIGGRKK